MMDNPRVSHPHGRRRGLGKRTSRPAALVCLFAALAMLWLTFTPSSAQLAQTPQTSPSRPPEPVTVTILPIGNNTFRASVLFPRVVEQVQAAAALETLAQRSGWQVGNVEWMETPQTGQFPAQTSVVFTVNTLFPNGEFPVEAFAVAFRSWRVIQVMFQHGGAFQYQGQPRYEDENAGVEITPGPNSLTLRYDIHNPNLERLTVAPPMAPGAPAGESPRAQRGFSLVDWALIAILGAALAWVLVYALMGGLTRKSRSRKPRAERR